MPNIFYNDQVTYKQNPPNSNRGKGKEVSDKKPSFKQVLSQPIGIPGMKDKGFQSKTKMTDTVS